MRQVDRARPVKKKVPGGTSASPSDKESTYLNKQEPQTNLFSVDAASSETKTPSPPWMMTEGNEDLQI